MKNSRTLPATVLPPHRPGQTLKLFAAAVFLAFAMPLIVLAGLLGWHQHRILTTWPAVEAVVTRAERISNNHQGSGAKTYSARFSFRYSAGGRVYQSAAELGYTPDAAQVDHWLGQMPQGSRTRLRYDPGNPAQISLAADYTPRSFAVPVKLAKWAAAVTALALVLLAVGWGRGRAGVSSQ